MASKALTQQMTRTVKVNRLRLLEVLKANREKHLAVFNEAMAGYKELALKKVEEAFAGLEDRLAKKKVEITARIESFTPETADEFSDWLTILEAVTVSLKKPVSYAGAYDAAVDMFDFEVRDEVELSGAELQCFIRDVWDWSYEFTTTNIAYTAKTR